MLWNLWDTGAFLVVGGGGVGCGVLVVRFVTGFGESAMLKKKNFVYV